MLDKRLILNDKDIVKQNLLTRGFDVSVIDTIHVKIVQENELNSQLQQLQKQRNKISAQIGQMKRSKEPTQHLEEQVSQIKKDMEQIEAQYQELANEVHSLLLNVPNLVNLDKTKIGEDEKDNQVLVTYDKLGRGLVAKQKAHYEIGLDLDLLDFERAAKISGSRFVIFKNQGARLVRALANFMLDTHIQKGYQELVVPAMVRTETLYGTGHLPKFAQDSYKIQDQEFWMIATSEISMTNYHNNEIIDLSSPKKFTGYTRCYRSEAGSGGKDTRGIIRSHEFHKVELVKIVSQEQAQSEYEATVADAEVILQLLEIPYRKVALCSGDLGFSSQQTIDLEAWMPSEQVYREVSSISLCNDFQARRAMIRYRNEDKKTQYAHTINGSGLAIDRIVAIILEQYQNEDGTIDIPKVLIPYMNNQKVIK